MAFEKYLPDALWRAHLQFVILIGVAQKHKLQLLLSFYHACVIGIKEQILISQTLNLPFPCSLNQHLILKHMKTDNHTSVIYKIRKNGFVVRFQLYTLAVIFTSYNPICASRKKIYCSLFPNSNSTIFSSKCSII